MSRLITDDYPCKAVYYWLLCNGGGDEVRVFLKGNSTEFVNKYGDSISFNHSVDFTDAKVYDNLAFITNRIELCGEEEE